jgi:hypothetical protein
MNSRPERKMYIKNPVVIRWQTESADFLQIEISPTHIFRIKVDKLFKK